MILCKKRMESLEYETWIESPKYFFQGSGFLVDLKGQTTLSFCIMFPKQLKVNNIDLHNVQNVLASI